MPSPKSYLIGEFMGDAGAWLQGDRFDATMNYTFRDICLRFLARSEIGAEEAADDLARLWAQYGWPVTLANQNLIGSHDTPRFLSLGRGRGVAAAAGDRVCLSPFPGPRGSITATKSVCSGAKTRVLATLSRGIPTRRRTTCIARSRNSQSAEEPSGTGHRRVAPGCWPREACWPSSAGSVEIG